MGVTQTDHKMDGWLYTIRFNRIGMQFSRKRFFILQDNHLKCYKNIPNSEDEDPIKSAVIDSCIRVTDDGRKNIHRKAFFIFTLYNTSDHNDHLKLGASSPEEAAKWICSIKDAAMKVLNECPYPANNFVAVSKNRWPSLRLHVGKKMHRKNSMDWTVGPSIYTESVSSDVVAPSPWKIFGCQNGLRLFKEAKDWDSSGSHWDDHPAIMAVGMVDATPEAIFWTLMSLDDSRSEWDYCLYRGSVVEHLDGHTDIVHKKLYSDWLPWGMKRRDLLMRRYWRREDDGTYVILYHSVFHKKCPQQNGYVRACLKSGGFVITPVNQGKQSLVKHMLAVDWKLWKLYARPSSARSITIRMLERVAALRELFKAKAGDSSSEYSRELGRDIGWPRDIESSQDISYLKSGKEDVKIKVPLLEDIKNTDKEAIVLDKTVESEKPSPARRSLVELHDASDEFFDFPEGMFFDQSETDWSSELSSELETQNLIQPRLSSAVGFVKKLQELAVHKKGYMDLQQELAKEEMMSWSYGTTLQQDTNCTLPCSWAAADPSAFLIRGENYLKDHQKIIAKGTLMQMVGADWLRCDRREDDLASRVGGIVQKSADGGGSEFFFVVTIQVPGVDMYTLALYYVLKTPLEENPLLHKFVNGDDAYRNSRFKLIPYISKGSWIVKQSVGKKACLLGQALEVHYFRGKNYLEMGIDVGSSTVARGLVSLVLGYLNNLVIEMAFLIQGNTEEELPEVLLGTCRLNNLDVSKAVQV